MKYSDIKKLSNDEISKKLTELKTELMKLNAQVAIGTTPKSTKHIRELKRAIAKIKTLKMQNIYADAELFKNHTEKMLNQKKPKKHFNL